MTFAFKYINNNGFNVTISTIIYPILCEVGVDNVSFSLLASQWYLFFDSTLFQLPISFFLMEYGANEHPQDRNIRGISCQVRCLSLGRGEEDAGGVGVQVSGILTRPRYMKLFNGVIYKTDNGESSSEPDDRVIQNTYILYYNINCTQAHT